MCTDKTTIRDIANQNFNNGNKKKKFRFVRKAFSKINNKMTGKVSEEDLKQVESHFNEYCEEKKEDLDFYKGGDTL